MRELLVKKLKQARQNYITIHKYHKMNYNKGSKIMTYLLSLLIVIPTLVNALSIDEAIKQMIETNPLIKVKQEEYLMEKESLTTSKSDYLPTIDVSYSVGPEATRTIANAEERVSVTREDFSLTLNQNVFAGFDTKSKVAQQKALVLSASDGVSDSANSIALETATAYLNILRSKELLDISIMNVKVHKKYLEKIKEVTDSGVGKLSDYKQTLSRYENVQSTSILSEQNYKNSVISFQRIVDTDASVQDFIKPTVGALPAHNLEELITIAIDNNPTISVSQADVQYAEASLYRSNAAFYPRVDIKAQGYWNKNLNGFERPVDTFVEEEGYNVLLVLSYNIFNGLAHSSARDASKHNLLAKKSSLLDTQRFIKASTTIAWNTFESTGMQLVHIDNNIKATAETASDYQEEYNLGRRSIIDLLNIELEHNSAKNRKVTTEYDRLIAYYQILTYSGKMLETMNVTIK